MSEINHSQIKNKANAIDYIECPSNDLTKSKLFFAELFNWQFQDYGPEYLAFFDGRLAGGFYLTNKKMDSAYGSALVVFYHSDLEAIKDKVVQLGGQIKKDIFSFPGGRRFHFTDLTGNEFALWSDK